MTSTVLILGAAGRLGQQLATTFADTGWRVRAQARKALPAALAGHPRVQPVPCDASDAAALADAAQGATVIVNALNPLYTQWDRLALPLADAALGAARASGALLMLPGNVYNFGRELPPRLGPDTPEQGNTPKARIRIAIEAQLAAAARDGVDSVVIRAGDFFGGAGSGSWFDLVMTNKLGSGKFIYPGDPDLAHAWAYLPDLAQVFERVAALRPQLRGHRRLHFAGHTVTGREFKSATEAVLCRSLRDGRLPWTLLRLGAPVNAMWRELLLMRYLWQRPHALDDAGLSELIGSVPHTPLPQALRAALAAQGVDTASSPRRGEVSGASLAGTSPGTAAGSTRAGA